MTYHVFIWNSNQAHKKTEIFSGTISYGTNWWIEHENNRSYKIIGQKVIDGQKHICVKKMNDGWCGEDFLGTENISVNRTVFSGLFSIPKSHAEWLMSCNALLD